MYYKSIISKYNRQLHPREKKSDDHRMNIAGVNDCWLLRLPDENIGMKLLTQYVIQL